MLYTESAYREVARCGPMVELEVLSAPGLEPGTHVRVTSAAVSGMTPDMRQARQRVSRGALRAARSVLGHAVPKLGVPTA